MEHPSRTCYHFPNPPCAYVPGSLLARRLPGCLCSTLRDNNFRRCIIHCNAHHCWRGASSCGFEREWQSRRGHASGVRFGRRHIEQQGGLKQVLCSSTCMFGTVGYQVTFTSSGFPPYNWAEQLGGTTGRQNGDRVSRKWCRAGNDVRPVLSLVMCAASKLVGECSRCTGGVATEKLSSKRSLSTTTRPP